MRITSSLILSLLAGLSASVAAAETTSISGKVYNDQAANGDYYSAPGLPLWRVYDDANNDGAFNYSTFTRSSETDPVPINDFNTTTSLIHMVYGGPEIVIGELAVTINLTHTWNSDLKISLLGPNGVRVLLCNGVGGDGDNFTNTKFSVRGAIGIASGGAPFSNPSMYVPAEDLRAFNGSSPNGTWTLEVTDQAGGDVGMINSWSLDMVLGENSALTDANGWYVLHNVTNPDVDHILREVVQPGWRQSMPSYVTYVGNRYAGLFTNFGNYRANQITGKFFHDVNRNAVKESTEAVSPNWTAFIDLNNNGTADSGIASTELYSETSSEPIEDFRTATSVMFVTNGVGPITDVNVTIRLTHTWDEDLDIYLVSPGGQTVQLARRVGANGDNFTNTTFDDQTGTAIGSGSAPFSGTYRPQTPLSLFNGTNPNGNWFLEVVDRASGDQGRIETWSLKVTCAETKVVSNSSGNYTIPNLGNGTYVVREQAKSGWAQTAPTSFFHTATVANGATASGKHFGNFQFCAVTGLVFKDLNMNGIKDGSETPLGNWRMFVDGNTNGVYDSGSTTKSSTDVPKQIPDPGTATSTLVVSGVPGVITDLNVRLTVGYTSGMNVTLIDPNGRRIALATDNSIYPSFTNATLDDEAGVSIVGATGPLSGSYRPLSPLRAVDGFSANGTWKLEVEDLRAHETGFIQAWSMVISYAEHSTLSNSSGNYTISNIIPAFPQAFRVDQVVPSGWFMTTPTAGYHQVTVGSGGTVGSKDFGDMTTPSAAN